MTNELIERESRSHAGEQRCTSHIRCKDKQIKLTPALSDVKLKKQLQLKADKTRYLSYLYNYPPPYDRNARCSWSKQKLASKHIKVSTDESWYVKSANT